MAGDGEACGGNDPNCIPGYACISDECTGTIKNDSWNQLKHETMIERWNNFPSLEQLDVGGECNSEEDDECLGDLVCVSTWPPICAGIYYAMI